MRRLFPLVVVGLSLAAAGCIPPLTTPSGPAPLRYRDEIFAGVTKTADIAYGERGHVNGATQSLELDMYRPTGDTVDEPPRDRLGPRRIVQRRNEGIR